MLATSVKGQMRGYWYDEGYIRTSSKEFTTKNLKNRMIHLTNDAVQKKGEDYGKYENGNKISFADFQKYLDNNLAEKKLNFYKTVYPKMMRLARDALTATHHVLDAKGREFTFEVFGLDFMIDEDFETWLI
jgi:tubulin monoglycylase TTLL3/8